MSDSPYRAEAERANSTTANGGARIAAILALVQKAREDAQLEQAKFSHDSGYREGIEAAVKVLDRAAQTWHEDGQQNRADDADNYAHEIRALLPQGEGAGEEGHPDSCEHGARLKNHCSQCASLVAQHAPLDSYRGCACGWRSPKEAASWEAHAAHMARRGERIQR